MEYIDEAERRAGFSQEPYGLALHELLQAEESGHDVTALRQRFETLHLTDEEALRLIYQALPLSAPTGSPFFEKSGLGEILQALPADIPLEAPSGGVLRSKIRGGWLGRIAGNMLGKPVEIGWPRVKIAEYLAARDSYPLRDYFPISELADAPALGFDIFEGLTAGRVDGSVRDDDIDYTILGLHLLETYGTDFTTRDVAYEWLRRFPVYQLYTAERAAYNNLVREVPFDDVGEFENPFREWIGALIRADIFGFVCPGDPRRAALLAYKDAALSHRANGIYGEMWAAALIATAFTAASPVDSVTRSLDHVPGSSRLALEVSAVLDDYHSGLSWDAALDALDARYPTMSWVHTINNAGALTAAILWGEGDYTATIALAVQAGLDTDSIGATAGSWAGVFTGETGIPRAWTEPLHDRAESALFGFSAISISDMAERTLQLITTKGNTPMEHTR